MNNHEIIQEADSVDVLEQSFDIKKWLSKGHLYLEQE